MGSLGPLNGTDEAKGLRILIIGAGIGGLTAAIALRQQGHRVELFEQSRFANEIGAAIHVNPSANGVLKRLGINTEDFGGVETKYVREFKPSGETVFSLDVGEKASLWRHRWLLVHRARLHQGLKKAVLSPERKGHPTTLRTSSKVLSVDPHKATITLESGEVIQGDVVIGADGVHSRSRKQLQGSDEIEPYRSGNNAFRFLIDREQALNDPETRDIVQTDGAIDMWEGTDRKVVIYPCNNNDILNFVCIHPDSATQTSEKFDWNQQAGKDKLIEVYKDFSPRIIKLLDKADPQTLKLWPLLDMGPLPSWAEDKLAVLGDAAHPFLPYRGSGGAMAIEDAVSLAVMLPGDVSPEEIPARLKLYEKARKERGTTVQQMTRVSAKGPVDPKVAANITNYTYGHDEFDHSAQILRKYLWSVRPVYWRQPTVFGPLPGPRQDHYGRDHVGRSLQSTFRSASIKFKTSRTLLQNLLPNDSFSFSSPGTVAYASFSQTTLDRMNWLGGGGYNHLGLYIHGVQYTKKNGEVIKGTYMPILFENLSDPIVSGREELGMPKLYTAIDVHQRNKSHHVQTSWQGALWGNFQWEDLEDQDPNSDKGTIGGEADDGILVYRYLPKVGRDVKGEAEAEYPVFVPHAAESKVIPTKVNRVRKTNNVSINIDGHSWDSLPTLHHVVSRLGEIPVDEVLYGKVVEGEGVPDVSSARRVE